MLPFLLNPLIKEVSSAVQFIPFISSKGIDGTVSAKPIETKGKRRNDV